MSADDRCPQVPNTKPALHQKAAPPIAHSNSWTSPDGIFRVRRGSMDAGRIKPCRWSGAPGKLDAYARDPLVRSPEGELRAQEGGRYTGNHTSKGRLVLKALFKKSESYRTQAEKIYAHFRREQLEPVAIRVFESLYHLLQAQVRHYAENPDLVDRFIFDERKRGEVYSTILGQFCGYQLDFQALLLEEVASFPGMSAQFQESLEVVSAKVVYRSFILLMQLKASILRDMGNISLVPTADFFGLFNKILMRKKAVFLTMNSFQERWIQTRLQTQESDEWGMDYVSVACDMQSVQMMSERKIRSYGLLRLISLLNAARENYRSSRAYQCLQQECLRRFSLLQSVEVDDDLLHEIRVVRPAKHFPFLIIQERMVSFIEKNLSIGSISEEKWSALENKVLEAILPQDILMRFSFWQLVETFCKAHQLCEKMPLEIIRLYDVLKIEAQSITDCPPYNEQSQVETSDLKRWLQVINEYAQSVGDAVLFSEIVIESVALTEVPVSSVSAERPVLPFTLSVLQVLMPRFAGTQVMVEIAPLLHWIITHGQELRVNLASEDFKSTLFSNPLLFSELMPSLLSYGDMELLQDLLLAHLNFSDSEGRFSALLQTVCEEYAVTCRLDVARLEVIAYATILKIMATHYQGNIDAHIQQLNIIFRHDIRAVFSYLDGMSETDFQALEARLPAIDFAFTVDPENPAIRPYLLLRSAPFHQRASKFTCKLVLVKQAAPRIMGSYILHAQEDCSLYSSSCDEGKAWLTAFFGIEQEACSKARQDEAVTSGYRYCDVVGLTFEPDAKNFKKLVDKVSRQVGIYRSKLGDKPEAAEASRWEAKLKFLSGLSRLFTESVTGDAYVPAEIDLAVIESQLKAISSVLLPWSQPQERYRIGHKELLLVEAKRAMHGSVCRGIINDFIRLLKKQHSAAASAEYSAAK